MFQIFCQSLDFLLLLLNSKFSRSEFRIIFSILQAPLSLAEVDISSIILNLLAMAELIIINQRCNPADFFALFEYVLPGMFTHFRDFIKTHFQTFTKFFKLAFDLCHYMYFPKLFCDGIHPLVVTLFGFNLPLSDLNHLLNVVIDISNATMKVYEWGITGFIEHLGTQFYHFFYRKTQFCFVCSNLIQSFHIG